METSLGCGYSIHEEFPLTDFYSPPSSVIDEIDEHEDDLSYHEEEGHDEENSIVQSQDPTLPSSLIEEINNINLNTLKTPSGTTPPPTPLVSHRSIVPPNSASSNAFPSMTIDHSLTVSPAKPTDRSMNTWSFEALSNTEMRNGNSLFSRPLEQIPKTNSSQLLGPTTLDRYLAEQSRLPDSMSRSSTTLEHSLSIGSSLNQRPTSLSGSNAEIPQEISRLYSYLSPTVEVSSPNRLSSNTSWSTSDEDSTYPFQSRITSTNPFASSSQFKATSWLPNANPFVPKSNPPASPYQQVTSPTTPSMRNPYANANANPSHWLLSEMSAMLRQNQLQQPSMITLNNNITLSTTAQQILASNMNNHGNNNNNNRPLRSEKIDIEIIKHLIQEAKWKRQCGLKKEVCVFCRNNGENELIYSSHSLKDSLGNVTCPILRAYQCPICGATGAQAHTIKYCQATGDENNQHIPTPYEKMMRTQCMQSFPFDENFTSTYPTLFDPLAASPSSLYTNGWSNSYL